MFAVCTAKKSERVTGIPVIANLNSVIKNNFILI